MNNDHNHDFRFNFDIQEEPFYQVTIIATCVNCQYSWGRVLTEPTLNEIMKLGSFK